MLTEMRTHLKSIAGFLIVFILFQSCVSLKSVTVVSLKSVTVDEAILQEKRVRINTAEGEKYRYKKLIRRDSILYGVKKIQGVGLMEQNLTHLNIIEVKFMSPGKTMALVVVSFLGVVFIIGALTFDPNYLSGTII